MHRLDGSPVEAPLAPTSELPLHLAVYAARPEVRRDRAHALARGDRVSRTLVDEVPAIHYYVAMFGGTVRVAPYATYGTDELASNAVQALRGRTACLHGQPRRGHHRPGPDDRARQSVYLEWLCDVYLRAAVRRDPAPAAARARSRPSRRSWRDTASGRPPDLAACRPHRASEALNDYLVATDPGRQPYKDDAGTVGASTGHPGARLRPQPL